ncbi:MAG TPA: LysM peptidoglycan-binding domain-containing protein [Anaerolineales bacterium]|nr:LysM peptidoglycan-binding domain-containing protein [Anaerolineales bacterium]
MRKTLLLLSFVIISACAPAPAQTTDVSLQAYLTATPIATSTPNVLVVVETPMPTSTLQVYTVQSGDTISQIAEKFKIPQENLIAANPDVNPNSLTIGQTLFIPDPSAPLAAASTPTPLPVPISQAACHPTADSGNWCFALIQNNTNSILENVFARITLLDKSGNALVYQTAYLPLDVIPANASLPVYVYFPNTPADVQPQVQLLSAMTGGSAYLPISLDNTSAQMDWNGKTAKVSGQAYLPAESNAATQVWIAAVAFDKYGTVVGVRRWEGGALQPGSSLNFDFSVSSVGGEIEAVEFFAQAK